jgi:hypothetical protein
MNSTLVGFEQTAAFCNNLPVILDELESSSVDLEKFIYAHCEGSAKARGAKNGGLREQPKWLNIAITNGEHPLTTSIKEGAVNRVISIESHGQVIPGDMSAYADTLCENYGFAGRMVVDWLNRNKGSTQRIKESYKEVSHDLMRSVTSKQANYGAALLIGDIVLDGIVFDKAYRDNILTKDDILPFLTTPGMIDINIKIRSWLCGFVVSEDQHFIHCEKIPSELIRTTIYGQKETDGSILIIDEVLKEELKRRNWNYSSFMRWCCEKGFILTKYTQSSRHWDIGATINGIGSVRVVEFLPSMFADVDNPQAEQIGINL